MTNAVWVWVVDALSPLVQGINSLASETFPSFVYEIILVLVAVYLGHRLKSMLDAGILFWLLFTVVIYGFLMSIGLGVT